MKLLLPLLLSAALLGQEAPSGNPSRWDQRFSGYEKLLFDSSRTLLHRVRYADLMDRLRLSYDGRHRDWFQIHVDYDNETHFGNDPAQPEFDLVRRRQDAAWLDLHRILVDRRHAYWDTSLYRGYVRLRSGGATLTLGRQRIAWGTARFWSPADVFNPINPLQIEGRERQGVDAAYLEWNVTGNLTGSTAYLPQDRFRRSTLAARLSTNLAGYDVAALAGRFERDWMGGGSFAGQWGGAGLRGEITWRRRPAGSPLNNPLRLTIGSDYAFRNTLYLVGEYFYNQGQPAATGSRPGGPPAAGRRQSPGEAAGDSRGAPPTGTPVFGAPALWHASSELFTLHRHFLSGGVGYDVTPLFRLEAYTVVDLAGGSAFFMPRARYNLTANTDLTLGAQGFVSRPGGEFDTLSPVVFVQWLYQF